MSRPRGGSNRNITITPKGLAMLAAIDRGDYIPLKTSEARSRAGTAQCRKINAAKKATAR